MKATAELINELHNLDIILQIKNDELCVNAPKGVLSSEILSELRERKSELFDYIKNATNTTRSNFEYIKHVNRNKKIPLSFAQQRLWFIDQLEEKASQAYNISGGYKLTGPLIRSALINALNRIVERHESLRTTFKTKDGVPVPLCM